MKIILTIIASAVFVFLSIFIGNYVEIKEDASMVVNSILGALVLMFSILIIGLIYSAIDELF